MNAADRFMKKLYDETAQRMRVERALDEGEDFTKWQRELRAEVSNALGKMPKSAPLNAREHSRARMNV